MIQIGSLTFFVMSAFGGVVAIDLATRSGWFVAAPPAQPTFLAVSTALVGTIVESLPIERHDNAVVSSSTACYLLLVLGARY